VLYYSATVTSRRCWRCRREVPRAGASVDIIAVPELVPPDVAKASYTRSISAPVPRSKTSPIMTPHSRPGTRLAGCRHNCDFLDQAGGLWARAAATAGGGASLRRDPAWRPGKSRCSPHHHLLHFGMVVVGLNYGLPADEARRGHRRLALGATTIAAATAAPAQRNDSRPRAIKDV